MSRSNAAFPRHDPKHLFASFEIGFMEFAILILELFIFFASIGGTVEKIRAKTYICRLLNRFLGIRRYIFCNLELFLRRS